MKNLRFFASWLVDMTMEVLLHRPQFLLQLLLSFMYAVFLFTFNAGIPDRIAVGGGVSEVATSDNADLPSESSINISPRGNFLRLLSRSWNGLSENLL